MVFGKFLLDLATKAGVDIQNEALGKLLAIQDEIPDEVALQFKSGLMTVEDAKQHPELSKYFKSQTLDPIDNELKRLIEELEIPDEVKAEIFAEKSTYKRVPTLLKRVKELEAKKADANKNSDKAALQQEIDNLNKQIKAINTEKESAVESIRKEFAAKELEREVTGLFKGKKYALKDLPEDVNITAAKALLQRQLESKGAQFVMTENGLKLVRKDNPELEYREHNDPVNPNDFVTKLLAENKMLEVTAPPVNGSGQTIQTIQPDASVTAFYEEQLAAYK